MRGESQKQVRWLGVIVVVMFELAIYPDGNLEERSLLFRKGPIEAETAAVLLRGLAFHLSDGSAVAA